MPLVLHELHTVDRSKKYAMALQEYSHVLALIHRPFGPVNLLLFSAVGLQAALLIKLISEVASCLLSKVSLI